MSPISRRRTGPNLSEGTGPDLSKGGRAEFVRRDEAGTTRRVGPTMTGGRERKPRALCGSLS